MMFFTIALLYKLEQTRRRRRLIVSGASLASKRVDAHSDRTTRMVLLMLSVFFCTEMPQGVLSILNGIYPAGEQRERFWSKAKIFCLFFVFVQ